MSAREVVARANCAERCAFMGEPPCWEVAPNDWPNPHCIEPGCHAQAAAGLAALREHLAKAVPACGCTNADCQIDATREAMLKALGDE